MSDHDDSIDAASAGPLTINISSSNAKVYIFRDGLLVRTYPSIDSLSKDVLERLPNDVFINAKKFFLVRQWYRKDLTPVFKDDLPKELEVSLLLLGVSS